jgi:hypothetical protein
MASDGQVQTDCVLVYRKGLNEVFNGLVGIVGEQELETVLNRFLVGNRFAGSVVIASQPAHKPANGDCDSEQQPLKYDIH